MSNTKTKMSLQTLGEMALPDSIEAIKRLFPDAQTCAEIMELVRFQGRFTCDYCGDTQEPYRFEQRPFVLRCRNCKSDTSLLKGSVAEASKTPIHLWFLAAFILVCHPNVTVRSLQRVLGLSRYETTHAMVRKIRLTLEDLGPPETLSVLDVARRGLKQIDTKNPA